METDKVSFNISAVDLGQIDLLIDQGFYASRTDFFVAAVRNLLQTHHTAVSQAVARKLLFIGAAFYSRKNLEEAVASGKKLVIRVVGVLWFADDVTPEIARAAIKSVTVFGKLKASADVKAVLLSKHTEDTHE